MYLHITATPDQQLCQQPGNLRADAKPGGKGENGDWKGKKEVSSSLAPIPLHFSFHSLFIPFNNMGGFMFSFENRFSAAYFGIRAQRNALTGTDYESWESEFRFDVMNSCGSLRFKYRVFILSTTHSVLFGGIPWVWYSNQFRMAL